MQTTANDLRIYQADMSAPDVRRIVSIDGEEKRVDGHSSYWLLAAGDDRGLQEKVTHDNSIRPAVGDAANRAPDAQVANHGLPTVKCFEFLLSLPEKSSDLFIAFSFTYDTTKILQDLPYAKQVEFARDNETTYKGYRIKGIPKKYLQISKYGRKIKIWDVFSYYQMSFAAALKSNLELFEPDPFTLKKMTKEIKRREKLNEPGAFVAVLREFAGSGDASDPDALRRIAFIVETKALRANDFPDMTEEEITDYCYAECRYTSVMYRDILINCKKLGLTPNEHSGPGALAAAFFTAQGVKKYASWGDIDFECGMPREVPMRAYYGGRFEVAELGNVYGAECTNACDPDDPCAPGRCRTVFQYDIHSAYPAVAVNLPCLRCGTFRRVEGEYVPDRWGFYIVSGVTEGPWAPFPFRTTGKRLGDDGDPVTDGSDEGVKLFNGAMKGSIAFPHGGIRWVTSAEVEVALRYVEKIGQITVHAGYVYETDCDHKPFADLEEIYLRRKHPVLSLEVPSGMNKVLKLIINSVYGKTAQSIGGRDGEAPPFQCYPWAAWMTGGTRAKVLEAALLGGENVVAIATDGILSKRPMDDVLPVSEWELGLWEKTVKRDCWIGKPGVYAFGRELSSEFKKRGLDSRYFPASWLREQWDNGAWVHGPVRENGIEQNPIGFMPLQLAVLRKNWAGEYGQWVKFPKSNSFLTNKHKRDFPTGIDDMDMPGPDADNPDDPDYRNLRPGTVKLYPFTINDEALCMPYVPKKDWAGAYDAGDFGDLDASMWEEEDLINSILAEEW